MVIVNGGRSKLNESAVIGAIGTELVGDIISANDALVRCKVPLPCVVEKFAQFILILIIPTN